MAVSVARAAGATKIFAIDRNEAKLEIAKRLGADETFVAGDDSIAARILERTDGNGADVLLEMSGAESAIDTGLQTLRNGATAAMLGIPSQPIRIDLAQRIIIKGITLLASMAGGCSKPGIKRRRCWPVGRSTSAPVVTHVLAYVEFDRAFAMMESGEAAKVVLDFKGDVATA